MWSLYIDPSFTQQSIWLDIHLKLEKHTERADLWQKNPLTAFRVILLKQTKRRNNQTDR